MNANTWIVCDTCGGSGGPPSSWDDERARWNHYVCRSCGGAGGRHEPTDDEETER